MDNFESFPNNEDCDGVNYLFSDNEDDLLEYAASEGDLSDEEFETSKKKPYWRLRGELASWASTSAASNTSSSVTDLLKILRPYGFYNLPLDSRALVKTPRETHSLIRTVSPGQYIHIGIQKGIEFEFKQNCVNVNTIDEIVVDCDMDGVRVCKSSPYSFWPIWCRISKPFHGKPFLTGNYFGKGEPEDPNCYVYDFVTEFNNLIKNGLKVEGDRVISVRFGKFIGDSPGKCLIFG